MESCAEQRVQLDRYAWQGHWRNRAIAIHRLLVAPVRSSSPDAGRASRQRRDTQLGHIADGGKRRDVPRCRAISSHSPASLRIGYREVPTLRQPRRGQTLDTLLRSVGARQPSGIPGMIWRDAPVHPAYRAARTWQSSAITYHPSPPSAKIATRSRPWCAWYERKTRNVEPL